MKKIISWFFLIQALSLLTVCAYAYYLTQVPATLAFSNYTSEKTIEANGLAPDRITITDLGIDLPVYQATIVNNVWPTTTKGASYLTTSPLPGSMGNSIIYAHNWESLFGHLRNAKVGEKVVVTFPDKTKKTFVIAYTSIVPSNQASILAASTDKRITLYTCTGFLDSERFVAVAILKKY
jgi:LPXTG-site transpeptidase (sortase) family protein